MKIHSNPPILVNAMGPRTRLPSEKKQNTKIITIFCKAQKFNLPLKFIGDTKEAAVVEDVCLCVI